jgi:hypothetical protein
VGFPLSKGVAVDILIWDCVADGEAVMHTTSGLPMAIRTDNGAAIPQTILS